MLVQGCYSQEYYPEQSFYPQAVQPSFNWALVTPALVAMMMLVMIGGMVRDLFTGKEVKMPYQSLTTNRK